MVFSSKSDRRSGGLIVLVTEKAYNTMVSEE
jgi:hypothetical protein